MRRYQISPAIYKKNKGLCEKHLPSSLCYMLHFVPKTSFFMSSEVQARRRYRFGVFQLDTLSGELYKHGIRIKLQDQPCQVLTILLERGGEMVTREELRQRLWDRDTYVDFDHSLNISINKLREALGDAGGESRDLLRLLPRKGYRFVASVSVEELPENRISTSVQTVTVPVPAPANPSLVVSPSEPMPPAKSWKLRLSVAALLLAVVAVGSGLWWKHTTAGTPKSGRVMLVVLPFEDLTGDKGSDFFVAGITRRNDRSTRSTISIKARE